MMEQFLTRRLLVILFGGLLLISGVLLYRNYSDVRNTLIEAHNGFKNSFTCSTTPQGWRGKTSPERK